MRKTAVVHLTDEQRADLTQRLERNPLTGRQRRRHQILLLADQGRTDERIVQATGAGLSTVQRADHCPGVLGRPPRPRPVVGAVTGQPGCRNGNRRGGLRIDRA